MGKFWGACNDEKAAMDWCFKAEKEEKRRANFEKTRAFNEEWRRKQDARSALGFCANPHLPSKVDTNLVPRHSDL